MFDVGALGALLEKIIRWQAAQYAEAQKQTALLAEIRDALKVRP